MWMWIEWERWCISVLFGFRDISCSCHCPLLYSNVRSAESRVWTSLFTLFFFAMSVMPVTGCIIFLRSVGFIISPNNWHAAGPSKPEIKMITPGVVRTITTCDVDSTCRKVLQSLPEEMRRLIQHTPVWFLKEFFSYCKLKHNFVPWKWGAQKLYPRLGPWPLVPCVAFIRLLIWVWATRPCRTSERTVCRETWWTEFLFKPGQRGGSRGRHWKNFLHCTMFWIFKFLEWSQSLAVAGLEVLSLSLSAALFNFNWLDWTTEMKLTQVLSLALLVSKCHPCCHAVAAGTCWTRSRMTWCLSWRL